MIDFKVVENGIIEVEGYCDLAGEDIPFGSIMEVEGYYRFQAEPLVWFSCGHMKRIFNKLSELNKTKR